MGVGRELRQSAWATASVGRAQVEAESGYGLRTALSQVEPLVAIELILLALADPFAAS